MFRAALYLVDLGPAFRLPMDDVFVLVGRLSTLGIWDDTVDVRGNRAFGY